MKKGRVLSIILAFALFSSAFPVNAAENSQSIEIQADETQEVLPEESSVSEIGNSIADDDEQYNAEVQKEEKTDSVETREEENDGAAEPDQNNIEEYSKAQTAWNFEKVTTDLKSPQPANTDGITISPEISGAPEGLQYKFVWMKNNWKEWGVIQPFSKASEAVWKPRQTGKYSLYVDVKDATGKTVTKTLEYQISDVNWKYEGQDVVPVNAQNPGEEIDVTVNVSGNTKGMQYKFVWMKDNWEKWGVLQAFSSKNTAKFTLSEPGDYKIYVDIKDWKGEITTKIFDYKIMTHIWSFDSISTDLPTPQEKYTVPITITPQVSGDTEGLKYKFVWEKDNWKKWGVIQKFSSKASAAWSPDEEGNYNLYVDIQDVDGRIITKHIPYQITKVNWKYEGIETTPEDVQKKGNKVTIKGIASGNTEGLQYKFVWEKDNWKEWGVIRKFSDSSECTWNTPKKSGEYKIYVDIKDRDGEIRTQYIDYYVATQIWKHEGVDVNGGVSEQVYTNIPITASASGETKNLKYKFVWMKDNWKEWGVIQDFSTKNTATWYPKEAGTYEIYSDIKDVDGRIVTLTQKYVVNKAPWSMKSLEKEGTGSYFVGDTATVTAVTSGQTNGLKFKFVQKNGESWDDWKVLRDFSTNNSVNVKINKSGNTYIYVDVKDQRGVIFDPFVIKLTGLNYSSASVSSSKISLGKSVQVYPNIYGGSAPGLECKYVWMKDNWSSWNVIKDFSGSKSVTWTPSEEGTYYIYIDARLNGVVKTKTVKVVVEKQKNGWYYEGGYKFYYINGVKQLDLDGILPKQSSYYIKVNRTTCSVTVYAKDGSNGYIIPVKRFACSVGLPSTPTPAGTYYTSNKYRWHTLIGPSYGQYCTRIVGGVLFHSVAGRNMTSYNLNARDYNKLGSPASHGCVRLCVRDAKWIYDNCSLGTKVTIYDSSDPGPLGKPATIKIPSGQTWDPTDPNI